MMWLFQQLWPLMLISALLGAVCTWLWMIRKVEVERARARTTTRSTGAAATVPATTTADAKAPATVTAGAVPAQQDDSDVDGKAPSTPSAGLVGAGVVGVGAATYAVGRFGAGTVDALPDGAQPHGYDIKGNADSMLYHTTDSPSYQQCKAEVWFKDEESATAAGFRRWDANRASAKAAAVKASPAGAAPAEAKDASLSSEAHDDEASSRVHQAGAAAAVAGTAAGIAAGTARKPEAKPNVVEGKDNVDALVVGAAPAGGVTYAVGRFGEGSVDALPGGSMPVGYSIKGNADSMLYHTMESPSYNQCKAEVWFKDESTAQLAGFTRWDAARTGKPATAKGAQARAGIADEPKHVGVDQEGERPLTVPSAAVGAESQEVGTSGSATPALSAAASDVDAPRSDSRIAAATAGMTAGMYAVGAFGEGSVDPLPNGAQPVGYAIKGNAQSKLYHTEDSPSYGQCKAEVWFRDEVSAEAAGFQHWNTNRRHADSSESVPTYPVGRFGPGSVDPLPDNAQPVGYDIKGNAQSMLFHTPQSPSYKVCIAEAWFKDEESAKAAGFKHWDRRKRGL